MALSGPSILVVTNDWGERVLIASTLRGAGFAVVTATDEHSAEPALRREGFAAVVIALPERRGTEFLHRARGIDRGLRGLVVLGAAEMPLLDEECATLIKRPFDTRELLGCLFELVLREEASADPLPHSAAAEFGIAAARLACLRNRLAIAVAAGAGRLAQEISRQIGDAQSPDGALQATLA